MRHSPCTFCGEPTVSWRAQFCSRKCYLAATTKPADERFWPKVEKRGPDECWPYLGHRDSLGYGKFAWNGRRSLAHRFALESALGVELGSLLALHSCDNPSCCNPAHLRAGTNMDNTRDKIERRRCVNQTKTHCKRGHPFSETNTFINKVGSRVCRSCQKVHGAAYRARARIVHCEEADEAGSQPVKRRAYG